jgi:tetratricopeptide (TPR) repeat protein
LRLSHCQRAAALLIVVGSAPLSAQRSKQPEFTRQGLLITNFVSTPASDLKLGRRAADAVRSRVGKLSNKREVDVIDGGDIRYQLERSSYSADGPLEPDAIHSLGRFMRADEYINGFVTNTPAGVRLAGELVLLRDERLRQPLPAFTAMKLDSAAELMAKEVAAARTQLVYQRRCENSLHAAKNDQAVIEARAGVAAYPRSTLARTCLVWALQAVHAPVTEVLAVARQVLAIDSVSPHAIEAAALALDTLHRAGEAADMWLRFAATDTSDLELALRVIFSLVEGGSVKRAEPFVVRMSDAHPDYLPLLRQKWRVSYENRSWAHAIEAAEALLATDSTARRDSVFYLRLATAYKSFDRPYKAIETLARGVSAFPTDPRLYGLYAQYIKAEADTVLPRGVALFPQSADLLALNAKDLRARGKLQESLASSRQAMSLDSTMRQGDLMIAQTEIELGRPDSALVSLRRSLARGEDSALVAGFALSKGNALYRAANGTHTSNDFSLALRYLALADSVRPTSQSRFMVGAAALGVAQSALTEAPKLTDKVESCRLARLGAEMVPMARSGLQAGQEVLPDAAKQSLDYLDTLDPYVSQQITAFCAPGGAPRAGIPSSPGAGG